MCFIIKPSSAPGVTFYIDGGGFPLNRFTEMGVCMKSNGLKQNVLTGFVTAGLIMGMVSHVYAAASNVKVSRFWHNHQPIYWPEWNAAPEDQRVQFAEESADLKGGQQYDSVRLHPENDLNAIFGVDDRRKAYQDGPRSSLAMVQQNGGYSLSYSGSLMDNVNSWGQKGENGYGGGWWDGNRTASSWTTPGGSPRLDLVGFTYHHSLGAVLPKSVLRKEIEVFKQAWWKAWNKNSDLSDHSKGFFPTEMGFSRHMIDVLAEQGYEWVIVASHHLSRTSPTYNQKANPEGSYNIFSSPPNKADQLGPVENNGWWFGTGNVGETAWNLAPYAYQLHRAKYINPETGAESTIIMVPSDDIQSYKAGYSGWQKGLVDANIEPYANDPARPCIVMPSTDGDNAWGGGSSSWDGDAPDLMNNGTYAGVAVQDFVNQYGGAAGVVHIEDGAWIFPESDYGSPQFLKWVEPPVANASATNVVFNTKIDIETPGFATKFYSWAPMIAGANWCETAEQMTSEPVNAWKIQDPYDNLGSDSFLNPNIVERAWHIYLAGLDSGFNYYGGLGNDDEVKTSIATRRAVELLSSFVNGQKATNDFTAPTVFKPQRFPYNPGWYTFGWFNAIPGNNSALKKMKSEFYIWTHAYDVSGITSIVVKVRKDNDGMNSMASNHNELYAGGSDVGPWTSISMTKRVLPNTAAALTAAANNGDLEYFSQALSPEVADYYFARIDNASLPNFRNNLLDYYIEAYDGRGNLHKSEIQHVWVEDDGFGGPPPSSASFSSDPRDCAPLTVTYTANSGPLSNSVPVKMWLSFNEGGNFTSYTMTNSGGGVSVYTVDSIPDNAPSAIVYFQNDAETITDNRNGQNWSTIIRDCDAPVGPSTVTFTNAPACDPVTIDYRPNGHPLQTATQVFAHIGFNDYAIVWPGQVMTRITNNLWRLILTPTTDVTQLDVVFNNGGGTWDNNGGADWAFALNECEGPQPPTGFYISNPSNDVSVGNATTAYILEGVGESVSGLLHWTNSLTGGSGTTFAGLNWEINSISLGVGSNIITVTGTNVGSSVVTNAFDSAVSYHPDGWTNGANLGSGWGDGWVLNSFGSAGRFIGTSVGNPNLTISTHAFGLWSQVSDLSEAIRAFPAPLAPGQKFRAIIQNKWIQEGQQGVGLALRNTNGASLIQFYFNGGDQQYTVEDAGGGRPSGIGYTDQGLTVEISILSSTGYVMKVGAIEIPGTYSGSLTEARFWNFSGGVGSNYDFFFDKPVLLSAGSGEGITTSDTVVIHREAPAGDSNGDGIPDSWYEQYGMNPSTPGLATDDTDSDQSSNWEEYLYDTNPTNSASYHVNTIEYINETGIMDVRVESPTSTGRLYDVYWATSLLNGTSWQPIGLDVPGNSDNSPVMLKVTNTPQVRYYRTGAKLPTP